MRDTMDTLFIYDVHDDIWTEEMQESLADMCKNLILKYGAVAKYGFFGSWDGPEYGGSVINLSRTLMGHITQDFAVPMSWDLSYAEKQETIKEQQRYCDSTELTIPAGSFVLRQWHHDGCNCYIIRPVTSGSVFNGKGSFFDWCGKHTKRVSLKEVL